VREGGGKRHRNRTWGVGDEEGNMKKKLKKKPSDCEKDERDKGNLLRDR